MIEIGASGGDEPIHLGQLRDADGGLHVGRLHVVAHVRKRELVIIAIGQVAQLMLEALAAGV